MVKTIDNVLYATIILLNEPDSEYPKPFLLVMNGDTVDTAIDSMLQAGILADNIIVQDIAIYDPPDFLKEDR